MTGPRIDHYEWAGGREPMLRFGPDEGPVVVAVMPLFEEANRSRALVVAILRALAARGFGGALPELPGTGESLAPTESMTLLRLRKALREAVATLDREGRRTYLLTIRGGALLDGSTLAFGRWQLAPMTGEEVLRDLGRVLQAAARDRRSDPLALLARDADGPPAVIAGNPVSRALLAELGDAVPMTVAEGVRLRITRYLSDARRADVKLPGTAPWRRAEPGHDAGTAIACADDIATWVRACEG